jgi:hypothetical protein
MVESKELIFLLKAIKNSTYEKMNFSRDCSFEIILLYTKIKELWHKIHKKCCFSKT